MSPNSILKGRSPGHETQHKTLLPLPKWSAQETAPLSVKPATINHNRGQYIVWASLDGLGWAVGSVGGLISEGEGFFFTSHINKIVRSIETQDVFR